MRMRWIVAAAVAWSALPSFEAQAGGGGRHEPEFEVVHEFVSGVDIPESVTLDDDGNFFISNGNTIVRLTPRGELSVFGQLPLPIFALGVKVGPDGCVYNASTSLAPEQDGAFVWRICEQGSVELVAELDQDGTPNDLAFDDDGNLFVTDPGLGRVWKLEPGGAPEVFAEHPLLDGNPADPVLIIAPFGVNGIAFDARQRFLYVSNTDQGSVLRIPLRSSSRVPSVFVQDPALRGADGIAFDRAGTLFVAVNALDSLVSVSRRGEIDVVAQGGLLDAPSSIVFGNGRRTRRTMYLTSSALSRTLGLQPGTPAPALLSHPVRIPGLPLR